MVIAIIKQKSLKAKWHPKDRFPSWLILNILDIDVFIQLGYVRKQIDRLLKKKGGGVENCSGVLLFHITNQLKHS